MTNLNEQCTSECKTLTYLIHHPYRKTPFRPHLSNLVRDTSYL
jgi:hypothetical protein